MALAYTAQLAYGYRRNVAVMVDFNDSQTAVLAQLDALLVTASTAYNQRRYQDAVAAYTSARELLWNQIYPLTTLNENLAWGTDLLRTLVSYSAEWLNVLPVEQASVGVRPRELVAVNAPVFGLLSSATDARGTAALADLQLSQTLSASGSTASAKFFSDRAAAESPDLIKQVLTLSAGAQSAPVTAAPAPATPAPGQAPAPSAGPVLAGGPLRSPLLDQTVTRQANFNPAVSLAGNSVLETATIPMENRVALIAGFGSGTIAAAPVAPVVVPPPLTVAQRVYSVEVAGAAKQVSWAAGQAAPTDQLLGTLYDAHRLATELPDVLIKPATPADAALAIAHAWYYETPLGLAECYHAMGNYSEAEAWYLRAASYQYLNAALEAPYVWSRLATLYLDWGNSFFRDDDAPTALPIYQKVLGADGSVPTSQLYTITGLKPAADAARLLIGSLKNPAGVQVNPAISVVIFDIQAQLAKISGGLDFWGHWAQNIPIWTFDYLQSVAANFCQLAIGAERDAMTFWEKADSGSLTRLQLTQNVGLSQAELTAANQQTAAAAAEAQAYQAAQNVAQLRASDATANATEYQSKSAQWTMHQALQTQLSGGQDGDASQLNQLADQMTSGPYSISGDRGTLAAAESLSAARVQRDYEIDTMKRQAAELQASVAQAASEVTAANARVTAAQASAHAAAVRVDQAQQLVAAFDQQRFTPDVWNALGDRMSQLSQRYLAWTIDVAKRMQRAYNFENDVALQVIRPDYTSSQVHGMLGSEALMADIQSFTYDQVTSTAPKSQSIKQTISLAQRYPFLLETQFRPTGTVDFQTDLDDFDTRYPGTYGGRIEHVEVAIDGIIPATGISGSLTNAGISHYRTPTSAGGALKHRVQNRETQIISDFDPRLDALVDSPDKRQLGVFEGAGLASTWTLSLPPDVNQLDFASIVDVRLTFTYRARFDPDLRTAVLTELASRPAAHARQRPFPLRWVFADAFFAFYSTGILDISLTRGDFAATETNPILTDLSLVVAATPHTRVAGIKLTVTAPGKPPVAVTTGTDGTVQAADVAAAVAGQPAIGAYRIALSGTENPSWVTNGALDLGAIDNIALVVGYTYTPRS